MAHNKTSDQISNNMSRVKNKNTTIEQLMENELTARGFFHLKNTRKESPENRILPSLQGKLPYSAMAIFGTATIGKKISSKYIVIEIFGFQKSRAILQETTE